jgi:GntR family transcriptional regulator
MPVSFSISPGSPIPIYKQIVDQVRRALLSGSLEEGEPLASVRALAEQLLINPNTVARAYADLTRDGLLLAQQGKGFTVAPRRDPSGGLTRAERLRRLEPALAAFLHEAVLLGFSREDLRPLVLKRLDQFLDPHERR